MTEDLKKIRDQIRAIGETIDYSTYPLQSLMIGLNWSDLDFTKAHDILEKYSNILSGSGDGKISHSALEADFSKELGIGYQDVKSVMVAMYKDHKWGDVCVAYKKSMSPNPPVELNEIS